MKIVYIDDKIIKLSRVYNLDYKMFKVNSKLYHLNIVFLNISLNTSFFKKNYIFIDYLNYILTHITQ